MALSEINDVEKAVEFLQVSLRKRRVYRNTIPAFSFLVDTLLKKKGVKAAKPDTSELEAKVTAAEEKLAAAEAKIAGLADAIDRILAPPVATNSDDPADPEGGNPPGDSWGEPGDE